MHVRDWRLCVPTHTQAHNRDLKQRVQELERGMTMLRSVMYAPSYAASEHDLKFQSDDITSNITNSSSPELKLASREHDIIQRQSAMLLAVRRELVTKTANYTSHLQRLEADVRAAKRAKHAAECEMHWKRRDQV